MSYKAKALLNMAGSLLVLLCWGTAPAWAEKIGGIPVISLNDVILQALKWVLKNVTGPLGSLIIFCSIAYTAYRIVTTTGDPYKRAEAMTAIPRVLLVGLVLGGIMLLANIIAALTMKLR